MGRKTLKYHKDPSHVWSSLYLIPSSFYFKNFTKNSQKNKPESSHFSHCQSLTIHKKPQRNTQKLNPPLLFYLQSISSQNTHTKSKEALSDTKSFQHLILTTTTTSISESPNNENLQSQTTRSAHLQMKQVLSNLSIDYGNPRAQPE